VGRRSDVVVVKVLESQAAELNILVSDAGTERELIESCAIP
jgi:hypothetical protein